MTLDPIRPYLPIAWLLLAAVLLFGGCRWGKSIERQKWAEKVAKKDQALQTAAVALRVSGDALREVNAEAERRIKAAEDQAKLAEDAAKVLATANAAAERREADFERRLANARRNPPCAALFDADLAKTCGVTPR